MDSNLKFRKSLRSSFYVRRKSTDCNSVNDCKSSSSEDELPDDLKEIVRRIVIPDSELYEKHTQSLIDEEEAIKSEYLRTKLAYELSNKIDEEISYVSSTECRQYLTDEDKLFIQEKPNYYETLNQTNRLINEITLMAHKKCAAIKTTKNTRALVVSQLLALKNSVGKFILESNNSDSSLSDAEEQSDSCLIVEEILKDADI